MDCFQRLIRGWTIFRGLSAGGSINRGSEANSAGGGLLRVAYPRVDYFPNAYPRLEIYVTIFKGWFRGWRHSGLPAIGLFSEGNLWVQVC